MAKSVANLGDVAAAAGVSKSTVSRVLNNKLDNGFSVSVEVRQRILEIAG
jgi:DNA-binding LacI/PurR family transcriptional regulator